MKPILAVVLSLMIISFLSVRWASNEHLKISRVKENSTTRADSKKPPTDAEKKNRTQSMTWVYYANPDVLDIMVNKRVSTTWTQFERSHAADPPTDQPQLVKQFLGISGVEKVTLDAYKITLWKSDGSTWRDMMPRIMYIVYTGVYD